MCCCPTTYGIDWKKRSTWLKPCVFDWKSRPLTETPCYFSLFFWNPVLFFTIFHRWLKHRVIFVKLWAWIRVTFWHTRRWSDFRVPWIHPGYLVLGRSDIRVTCIHPGDLYTSGFFKIQVSNIRVLCTSGSFVHPGLLYIQVPSKYKGKQNLSDRHPGYSNIQVPFIHPGSSKIRVRAHQFWSIQYPGSLLTGPPHPHTGNGHCRRHSLDKKWLFFKISNFFHNFEDINFKICMIDKHWMTPCGCYGSWILFWQFWAQVGRFGVWWFWVQISGISHGSLERTSIQHHH